MYETPACMHDIIKIDSVDVVERGAYKAPRGFKGPNIPDLIGLNEFCTEIDYLLSFNIII